MSQATTTLGVDVGGTNFRAALFDAHGENLTGISAYPVKDFATAESAVQKFFADNSEHAPPARIIYATCGVVDADVPVIASRNNPWQLNRAQFQQTLGIPTLFVNDFIPQAYAALGLNPAQNFLLKKGSEPTEPKPIVVIGPGTGLGVSVLVPIMTEAGSVRFHAIATEGGNNPIGVRDKGDLALLYGLINKCNIPHPTYEDILSGRGLPNLYRAICYKDGSIPGDVKTAEDVALLTASDIFARRTLEAFWTILAGFAATKVLDNNAAAVFVSGGVPPKLLKYFNPSAYAQSFMLGRPESQRSLLERSTHNLITAPDPAFIGLAQMVRQL
jgi:glucokinase